MCVKFKNLIVGELFVLCAEEYSKVYEKLSESHFQETHPTEGRVGERLTMEVPETDTRRVVHIATIGMSGFDLNKLAGGFGRQCLLVEKTHEGIRLARDGAFHEMRGRLTGLLPVRVFLYQEGGKLSSYVHCKDPFETTDSWFTQWNGTGPGDEIGPSGSEEARKRVPAALLNAVK